MVIRMKQTIALISISCSLMVYANGSWSGKEVSVLGDSYSAYKNSPGSLGGYYPTKTINSLNQMWWAQVIDAMGGNFLTNRSCAGAAIYTTYGCTRSMWYMAGERALGDPDVILVMGGLNDFWVLQPAYGHGLSQFRSSVNTLFTRLANDYPKAEKVIIIGKIHSWQDYLWGLTPEYRQVLRDYSHSFGFRVVDLDGCIGTEDGDYDTATYPHPTAQGHTKIAQRIIACLKHDGTNDYDQMFDCLELDDRGYMLTDYVPNLATTKIEVKLKDSTVDAPATNAIYYASGFTQGEAAEGDVYSLVVTNGVSCYSPSEPTNSDLDASGPLVIGAERCSSNGVYSGMCPKKIYGVKIWEGQKLVRDFVPVLDVEGHATLYDTINDDSLAVYGGSFIASNYADAFVNRAQCQSYANLATAYAAANVGECIEVRESPASVQTVTARLDVAVNTLGCSNIVVVAPSIAYRVVFKDGVYSLVENDGIAPTFVCDSISDLFAPVEGKLHIRLGNIISGATYLIYTATSASGPWSPVASGFEQSEFEISAPDAGTSSFFIKAEVSQ